MACISPDFRPSVKQRSKAPADAGPVFGAKTRDLSLPRMFRTTTRAVSGTLPARRPERCGHVWLAFRFRRYVTVRW